MEVNTVCISVKEYTDLLHIKDCVDSGLTVAVRHGDIQGNTSYFKVSTGNVNQEIVDENCNLSHENTELTKKAYRFKIEIEELKKMSIWQFIKYRHK